MPNAPVQVILNADDFRRDRDTSRPASAGTDFFAGRDADFRLHRDGLQQSIKNLANQVRNQPSFQDAGGIGFVKVTLQASALAKSHRPTQALFRPHITPIAGAGKLGEIISQVDTKSLAKVEEAFGKAEIDVRQRADKKTGEMLSVPTRYRCEVGAIEKLELWDRADRRRFDLREAVRWLSDPRTGHCYLVELFERPPQPGGEDLLSPEKRKMFDSFFKGLSKFAPGIVARLPEITAADTVVIEVRLNKSEAPAAILINAHRGRQPAEIIPFDDDVKRHAALIEFLESHPLVREISLPSILIQSAVSSAQAGGAIIQLPSPAPDTNYPKVGVIDGGLCTHLAPWTIYQHNFLPPEHQNLEHGSFIGGLLVAARQMNPQLNIDPDGCQLADINIFPDEKQPNAFEQYFPNGLNDFFDELATAVAICRQQYGIRVFNMSLNTSSLAVQDRYSAEARRLDQIADENDVVFVISAGNLDSKNMRPEWPANATQAAAQLAAHRNDALATPAESLRNVSVSAINPPGLSNAIDGAPARYTRRGPGLRTSVKPDLCQVGGSGTVCPTAGHGLNSHTAAGAQITSCGTSFSAPLVAKLLATLDKQIEGNPSRETLIALALHNATVPDVFAPKMLNPIAKQLVGFGRPSPANAALEGGDHQITLSFASRVMNGKTLEFRFAWPPSLVGPGGKCRGSVRLTLVATPHLNTQFGEELIRANIEAALQQEQPNGKYKNELEPTYVFFTKDQRTTEADLIEHKFKWSPVKVFETHMPRGRGKSSNWRLVVNYLTRADEQLPEEGIPFTVLLTISDPEGQKPVFQEMRQALQAAGILTQDIRTATRVSPRV